ncbi:barstar family protein [Streptomyces sp. TLI_185]|uniref:barstar family protein n=1 Tax=Streptomyces sp. TLI_185 TaxID=2485151 RepID=UPI000F4D7C62|nr:barstar family protein [Streptomyces sp. TLI_185]RPF35066.1 barstar (barnase inhibitor) [Streptomyces sp. TLI_185]
MQTITHSIRPLSASETVPASAKEILGTRCRTTIGLFAEWAGVLGFPDWFGHNWNAFEDCLRTMADGSEPVTIVLRNAALLLEDEDARQLGILLDILAGSDFGLLLLDDSACDLGQLARRMTAAGFTPPTMP